MIVALVAARAHHEVIDIVQLYGEHDADATRISCHETEILFPKTVLWRTSGSVNYVIDALLSLPDPMPGIRLSHRPARTTSPAPG
jgi:hypothetical protein